MFWSEKLKQLVQNYRTGELKLEEVLILTVTAGSVLAQSSYSLEKS